MRTAHSLNNHTNNFPRANHCITYNADVSYIENSSLHQNLKKKCILRVGLIKIILKLAFSDLLQMPGCEVHHASRTWQGHPDSH